MVWKIWTKIYCSARNLLVHHSSLSHTTYVETNKSFAKLWQNSCRYYLRQIVPWVKINTFIHQTSFADYCILLRAQY